VAGGVLLMQAANRDEIFVMTVRVWKNLSFQDVAKKGYGDEEPEAEKKQMEECTKQYRPLLDFFTKKTNDLIKEVTISNCLVTSPCAITSVTRFGGHSGSAPDSKFTPLKGGPVVISDFANLNWPEGSHHGHRELSLAVMNSAWPSSSRLSPLPGHPSSSPGRPLSLPGHHRPCLAVMISGLDFVNSAWPS